ncbi:MULTISPECIES: TfoX/Sxy family protein [Nocardiaceae]|uniref:TfoX/Sxy family transcriptional regulator of competence genes n=1 Tax=Rhodococcoides corynebacterioides TaxID=53972 RepID=A0ABS2KNZ8_9NOCA|nr:MULTISPECIES: TfoX/Sxy family protein [Rhodococcus]MBM7413390.1 TfoX/Sxy family transcriptional regulator of competence genes [Rhodococcus corynebacterioides]MBP1115853.1 TfoX/Sxy family transcriptional regulator of competence genes [Rhodococcus sp. PvP016]
MAYDITLANRVRAALSEEKNVRERKMFGGFAFTVDERMAVCVGTGGGALLTRVPADRDADYLAPPGSAPRGDGRGPIDG